MTWKLTMLGIHLAALGALGYLLRRPPCWIQRTVLIILMAGMFILACADVAAIRGLEYERHFLYMGGLALEHLAVLLYVFRLIYQQAPPWPTSSMPFRNSPH